MKKIVKEITEDVVPLNAIKDTSIVGIEKNKERYIVMHQKDGDVFKFRLVNDRFLILPTLYTSIQDLINKEAGQAYLFTTHKEAVRWLHNI